MDFGKDVSLGEEVKDGIYLSRGGLILWVAIRTDPNPLQAQLGGWEGTNSNLQNEESVYLASIIANIINYYSEYI